MSPGPARKMEAGPAFGCPTLVAIICVPGLRAMATMRWRMLPGFTRPQAPTTSRWAGQSSASCSRLCRREHSLPSSNLPAPPRERSFFLRIFMTGFVTVKRCEFWFLRLWEESQLKQPEEWYVVKQRTTAQSCTVASGVCGGDGPKKYEPRLRTKKRRKGQHVRLGSAAPVQQGPERR